MRYKKGMNSALNKALLIKMSQVEFILTKQGARCLDSNIRTPRGTCSWRMDPGPTTTWRDDITKSRRSLGRITSTSIFEMVELFKLEQASSEVGLRQLMAGRAVRSVPPKQRNKRNFSLETTH